jgi:hypothetical protein
VRTFWLWFSSLFFVWDVSWLAYDVVTHQLGLVAFQAVCAVVMAAMFIFWMTQD